MAVSPQPSLEPMLEASNASGSEDEEMAEAAGATATMASLARAVAAAEAASESGSEVGSPAAPRRLLVTCCCWEWRQPVLVAAMEDGSTWRLPLPSPGSAALAAAGSGSAARLAQPARCLAALPGGLLVWCMDCSGLQLLRLSTAAPLGPGGPAYEPLQPLLQACQPQEAGCCTLPAAVVVADCLLADLEGGGQPQVYAACRTTGGGASGGGTLCVLYPDPKPETVFELPGAAEVRRHCIQRASCLPALLLSFPRGNGPPCSRLPLLHAPQPCRASRACGACGAAPGTTTTPWPCSATWEAAGCWRRRVRRARWPGGALLPAAL